MDVFRQEVNLHRIGIASHEGDTGDVVAKLFDESIDSFGIQRLPDVLP